MDEAPSFRETRGDEFEGARQHQCQGTDGIGTRDSHTEVFQMA